MRNEDLDVERSRREYALQAQRDLEALGLFWDEGGDCSGPHAPYDQSQRFPFYRTQLERLESQGLVYPCFCSRAQLHAASAPHASDGETIYAGTCRGLSPQEVAERSKTRAPACGCKCRRKTIAFTDLHYGPQQHTCPPAAGISSSAAPTGSTPTSWPWWPTTAPWGSPRWCGGGTCCPPPPGRSCCTGCWAGLCRNLPHAPAPGAGGPAALQAGRRPVPFRVAGKGADSPGRGGAAGLPGGACGGTLPHHPGGAAAPLLLGQAPPRRCGGARRAVPGDWMSFLGKPWVSGKNWQKNLTKI